MNDYYEVNFDGMVGPAHNYAGLAIGNIAAQKNAFHISNPRLALMQGLDKMELLMSHGVKQGLLPPHARPNIPFLRSLGFNGSVEKILQDVYKYSPQLLAACYSSSSMWSANSATVSPSADTSDGRVHFTTANLATNLHRTQEADFTYLVLKNIFNSKEHFVHHKPLLNHDVFTDEGAANHTRLCENYNSHGVEIFTYGKSIYNESKNTPKIYPARQTLESSQAIMRAHGLLKGKTIFVQQNPEVIDQGVFHNDVIAVGNKNILFFHQDAFLNQEEFLQKLNDKTNFTLKLIEVSRKDISVSDALTSYIFNSQLITNRELENILIAPIECYNNQNVKSYLESLSSELGKVEYIDCRQSMLNGGGPACLRLRVVLSEQQLSQVHQGIMVNPQLISELRVWGEKHYRENLSVADLLDPKLVDESYQSLDELTDILNLGSIYDFQQVG